MEVFEDLVEEVANRIEDIIEKVAETIENVLEKIEDLVIDNKDDVEEAGEANEELDLNLKFEFENKYNKCVRELLLCLELF